MGLGGMGAIGLSWIVHGLGRRNVGTRESGIYNCAFSANEDGIKSIPNDLAEGRYAATEREFKRSRLNLGVL
jgi:hypothetical protein